MTHLMRYRCIFFDASKGFVGSDEFASINDAFAVERATILWREHGTDGLGFEVWQGIRLIHRQEPPKRT